AQEIFGGGEARLVEVRSEREIDAETGEYIEGSEHFEGIDILATPPGKRLKPVSLLSGGERALVSIALLCAIMQTNPSPFVVLDEVDAALDEANARRFGEVLARLSKQTQVVVITHNRATMVHADTVYGVSMTHEGVSSILSLRLEQ
nr:AAA family ATPase [Patescibacteria group bacterium]